MVLEDALTKDPAIRTSSFQMGESFAQAMDFAFAERCYREAIEYAPDAVQIHERLSEALRRQEKFDEAKEAVAAGLALDAENAGLLTALSAPRMPSAIMRPRSTPRNGRSRQMGPCSPPISS